MATLAMSGQERRRLQVLSRVQSRVQSRELSLVKAAELLGICYRHSPAPYQLSLFELRFAWDSRES